MDAGSARPTGRGVRWAAWALAAALWALCAPVQAAERRVALVIGNAAYESPDAVLKNPGNDAEGMAEALGRLGFEVVLGTDLDQKGFLVKLKEYEKAARGADVALFFYAGHGLQVKGKNWLMPIDAKLESDLDLEFSAVRLDTVMGRMGGTKKLVFLDACRNNPLARGLARSMGLSRTEATSRGLARVKGVPGTLVVYATEANDVASDGDGDNSPFTEALLAHIERPGLNVFAMIDAVAQSVYKATNEEQLPSIQSSPMGLGTFSLASAALPKDTGTTAGGTPDKTPPPAGDAAKAAYKEAKEVGNVAAMLAVVKRFPGTFEADLAQAWIDKHEQPIVVAGGDPDGIKPGWEVGEKFRDCPECPEMVVVPEGIFLMGSTAGDDDERPVHEVTIARPFAVGVYEVTFAEWDACVSDGGCGGYRPSDRGWGRGRRPVMNVSWKDAKAYVRWLSERTGEKYRLLSEAEWEYVARAGTTTAYWWGDEIGQNRANCDGCGSRWDDKRTAPVGSFPANPFGLHDVHGNVWEWVEDCWEGNCGRRVLRGGSWNFSPRVLRSAFRLGYSSGYRGNNAGFRVARTLTP